MFDTRYNGNYAVNLMGGKEFRLNANSTLQVGGRAIYGGGLRYTPGDPVQSRMAREHVPQEALAYTEQVQDYFRMDVRISWRKNLLKVAYICSFDAQNITNRQNVRDQIYDPGTNRLEFRNQSGLIPVVSFQVDF